MEKEAEARKLEMELCSRVRRLYELEKQPGDPVVGVDRKVKRRRVKAFKAMFPKGEVHLLRRGT